MNILSDKYYNLEEVAEILKVTPRSVQNYLKEGKLTGKKFGGRWNFTKNDIIQYINTQSKGFLDDSSFINNRENYSKITFNYFFENNKKIEERMQSIVDNFNNYKKTSPKTTCKMICQTRENNLLEVSYIGKEVDMIPLIRHLSN